MEQRSNKTIVAEFYKKIVGGRDSSLINTYVREDYIQHSAMGKGGRQGLFEMVEFLKTLPPSTETTSPVRRLLGDGDMVIIQLDISFMGKRVVVIDLFRVEDGMLAEHWDAMQEIPDQDSMTNGSGVFNEHADTINNKALANNFYRDIFTERKLELMGQYMDADYIEHSNGVNERLDSYLLDQPDHQIKVHRIMGEGDFVVVQSEYNKGDVSFALYDILRVENNKIAEHWSVQQQIPAVMAHDNGMF